MNGNTPTLISGVPKRTPVARDDEVARQRETQRAGQHVTVGGADRRLAELADDAEQAREAISAEVLVHERRLRREPGQVAAAREHLLVGRGEHDAADGGVVTGRLEGGDQVVEDLVGERVARVGLVERDRGDAGFDGGADGVGHAARDPIPFRVGRSRLSACC